MIYKIVLNTYGFLHTYRIKYIDIDTNQRKKSFNIKDGDKIKTISIEEYYKIQYKVNIKDPDQPLLIAERKTKGKKSSSAQNSAPKEKENSKYIVKFEIKYINNTNPKQEEQVIFLVPELLYTTGKITETDSKDKRRNIINKTKVDPNKKME